MDFEIQVYDKDFARQGWIGDPLALDVTLQHNDLSVASLTVTADHLRSGALTQDGARVVIYYQGVMILSGPVVSITGEGPTFGSSITVTVEDDFRLLMNTLGWPVPTSPITDQTAAAYNVATGPAETIVKTLVTRNAVTRLGRPVTVATDLGRGATISGGVKVRMHTLFERLFPAVDQAGIGVTVKQSGAGLLLDVYEPRTYPRVLSEVAGTLTSWKWSNNRPTATRIIAGGSGEATARVFDQVTGATRETSYGDIVEVFTDARDTENSTELRQAAQEEFDAAKPTNGLAVTLAETPTFRYGDDGVRVGDSVMVQIGEGTIITDILRSVTLSWSRDEGAVIAPAIGDRSDDPDLALSRTIRSIIRALNRRKN